MRSRATFASRRASGHTACRSMNSGCASPSTASSPSSTSKHRRTGRPMAVCAPSPIRFIASSSGSISSKVFAAKPTSCCAARPAARISPNCAAFCRPQPFRHSPARLEDRERQSVQSIRRSSFLHDRSAGRAAVSARPMPRIALRRSRSQGVLPALVRSRTRRANGYRHNGTGQAGDKVRLVARRLRLRVRTEFKQESKKISGSNT